MSLTPVAWRYAFPRAKGTAKRVRVFKAEQICGLVQLQHRVGKVIPRHLMSSFIQDTLKAGAGFLQAALQRARAHVERLRDGVNGWPLSCEPVLNGAVHQSNEVVLVLELAQLLFELRREQIEQ